MTEKETVNVKVHQWKLSNMKKKEKKRLEKKWTKPLGPVGQYQKISYTCNRGLRERGGEKWGRKNTWRTNDRKFPKSGERHTFSDSGNLKFIQVG